ncbi:Fc.00g027500.m01.CDS01 [Cosmosporella sp. VM-42]
MVAHSFAALWLLLTLFGLISFAKFTPPLSLSTPPISATAFAGTQLNARDDGPRSTPIVSADAALESAKKLVEKGQSAMKIANAEILDRPQRSQNDRVESARLYGPAPTLTYEDRKRDAQNTSEYAWSYTVPEELVEAARIMAEASPPSTDGRAEYRERTEAIRKERHQQKDTFAMAPVLQKPNGLNNFEDASETYRFSSNGSRGTPDDASIGKRSASTWWMAKIKQHGSSPYAPDGYKVWRNVKDYGAKGDGITDHTAAINKAISDGGRCGKNCRASTIYPATVYIPPGTYLVSSPIIQYYNTEIIGDPLDVPTIVAAPSFVGVGVITSNVYTGGNTEWYSDTSNVLRSIRNLYIDIRCTPEDAHVCGIHWQVGRGTSIENVAFWASKNRKTTQYGIYMENGSGGFLANLAFFGGKFGAFMGNQQFTGSELWFADIFDTAIQLHWDWGWMLQGINFKNVKTGIKIVSGAGDTPNSGQGVGSLVVTDVQGEAMDTVISTSLLSDNATSFLIQNGLFNDADTFVVDEKKNKIILNGDGDKSRILPIKSWGYGKVIDTSGKTINVNGGDMPAPKRHSSLTRTPPSPTLRDTKYYYTRRRPTYADLSGCDFINARSWGAKGDSKSDDTAILNYIFSAAANMSAVVYIPYGIYVITDTVNIPVGSRVIGQTWPQILATGEKFQDINAPRPAVKVGVRGNEGIVEIQSLLFTVRGPTAGAVLLEWNVYESFQGSAGLWDSHFRVGGAKGSDLQATECLRSSKGVNDKCLAASLMLHITSSASAYLENVWVWAADHDIDDKKQSQIDVYAARGILIESRGPTWLWGTSVEHCVLYQYTISSAKNVFSGLIQTESPYFQPEPAAPKPFDNQLGAFPDDPTFADCNADSKSCHLAWGIRILDSSAVHILSSGLYSWFQDYDRTCVDSGKHNCQEKVVYTEQSSDIWLYNLFTIGATEIISPFNETAIEAAPFRNGYTSSILSWHGGINGTTGNREYEGYKIYDTRTVEQVRNFTQACRKALTTTIKCHDYTRTFRQPKYHGLLINGIKDDWVCAAGCLKSVDQWVSSVQTLCGNNTWNNGAPADYLGGYIQYGLKEQCQKDSNTGEYCNNVIDGFKDIETIEDLPKDDLCSNCYTGRLKMMQKSPYSIYRLFTFYQDALKLAAETCCLSNQPTDPQSSVVPAKVTETPWCLSNVTYTTSKGDTCNVIAVKFGVSSASLFIGNSQIRNCSNIETGSEVCLPAKCTIHTTDPGDTCTSVFAATGVRTSEILKYNPWISNDCSNLVSASYTYGNVLCISPAGGLYNGTTNNTAPYQDSREYVETKIGPPSDAEVANGTTLNCGRWHTAKKTDSCASITRQNITAKLFRIINPSLKGGDCSSKLVEGRAYCTGPTSYWDRATRNVSDIVSYGCFESTTKKLVLAEDYTTDEKLTRVENCGNYCLLKQYMYWGLQKGNTCSCGWELALNSKKADESKCSTDCVGGGKLLCGGDEAVSVYGLSETLKKAYTKIGCYTDTNSTHALGSTSHKDDNLSSRVCAEKCLQEDYTYFGMARGNECHCGNSISSSVKKVELKECNASCPGNSLESCGQKERILIYGTVAET